MKKIFLAVFVLIMFLLLNKYAQAQTVDVTGTWEGHYEIPAWNYDANFIAELAQTGSKIKGKATTEDGCKGKVKGNIGGFKISFKVKIRTAGSCCSGKWKGTAIVNEGGDYMYLTFTIHDDCRGDTIGSGELSKVGF